MEIFSQKKKKTTYIYTETMLKVIIPYAEYVLEYIDFCCVHIDFCWKPIYYYITLYTILPKNILFFFIFHSTIYYVIIISYIVLVSESVHATNIIYYLCA